MQGILFGEIQASRMQKMEPVVSTKHFSNYQVVHRQKTIHQPYLTLHVLYMHRVVSSFVLSLTFYFCDLNEFNDLEQAICEKVGKLVCDPIRSIYRACSLGTVATTDISSGDLQRVGILYLQILWEYEILTVGENGGDTCNYKNLVASRRIHHEVKLSI